MVAPTLPSPPPWPPSLAMASLATAGRSIAGGGGAAGGAGDGGATGRADPVDRNPFILPSDEDVFRMRETERKKKEEVRSVG